MKHATYHTMIQIKTPKGLLAHGSKKDLKTENDRKFTMTDASIDTVSPRKHPFLKYLNPHMI